MKDYNSFEELEVWKLNREFRNEIAHLTKKFPKEEKFELTRQIKRSSRSVTANIAEGHGRYGFKGQYKIPAPIKWFFKRNS